MSKTRTQCDGFATKTQLRNAMKRYGMTRCEFERAAKVEGLLIDEGQLLLTRRWLDRREREEAEEAAVWLAEEDTLFRAVRG